MLPHELGHDFMPGLVGVGGVRVPSGGVENVGKRQAGGEGVEGDVGRKDAAGDG
ncbi:MAG: hypothetical protein JJK51_00005, partial [Komagataeibacter oboediens]|nr:hypothetical protein [Komagataeibacter oboediens]